MSVIYSIIPIEQIFNDETVSTGFTSSTGLVNGIIEMNHIGSKVLAIRNDQNKLIIQRIISTNPRDYLNPKLQPGMEI